MSSNHDTEAMTLGLDEHFEEIGEDYAEGHEPHESNKGEPGDEAGPKKKSNLMTMGIIGAVILGTGFLMASKFGLIGGGSQPHPAPMAVMKPSSPPALAQAAAPAPAKAAEPAPAQMATTAKMQNTDAGEAIGGPVDQAAKSPFPMPVADAKSDAPKEGLARGLDAITQKVDEIFEKVSNLESLNIGERLTKLEDRVAALEAKSGKEGAGVSKHAGNAKHVAHSARKAKSARVSKVSAGSRSHLEKSEIVEVISDAPAASPAKYSSFSLQAVIPGRLWIKMADGSSLDYTVGDSLPDGSKVLKIDVEEGQVKTSAGILQ